MFSSFYCNFLGRPQWQFALVRGDTEVVPRDLQVATRYVTNVVWMIDYWWWLRAPLKEARSIKQMLVDVLQLEIHQTSNRVRYLTEPWPCNLFVGIEGEGR